MTMKTEFQKLLGELPGYTLRKTMRENYTIKKLRAKTQADKEKWMRLLTEVDIDLIMYEIGAREMYSALQPKIVRDWRRTK